MNNNTGQLTQYIIDDKRKQYNACQICAKSFNLLNQEHQCKRCKRAVCSNCSQQKAIIIGYVDEKTPHRVCSICKQEIDFIQKLITEKKVQFSIDCSLAKQWLGYMVPQLKGYEELLKDYESMSIYSQNSGQTIDTSEYNYFQSVKEIGIKSLMGSLHYSLKEFIYYATKNKQENEIFACICNIISAVMIKIPKLGYTPEFLQLTLFITCFCSEVLAYHVLVQIFNKILPEELYPKFLKQTQLNQKAQGAIMEDIQSIIQQSNYKIQQNEVQTILQFIEGKFLSYAYNLGMNFFNFETSYFVFDLILRKSQFMNFEVAVAIALCKNKDIVISSNKNSQQIELGVLRKLHAKTLMSEIQNLQQQGFQMKRRKSTLQNFQEEQKKQIVESEFYQKLQKENVELQEFFSNIKQENIENQEKITNLEAGIIEREQQMEILQKQVKLLEEENVKLGISVSLSKSSDMEKEILSLKKQIQEKDAKCQEYFNQLSVEQQKYQQLQLEQKLQLLGNQDNKIEGNSSKATGSEKAINQLKEQLLNLENETGKLRVENKQLLLSKDQEMKQLQSWKLENEQKEQKFKKDLEKLSQIMNEKEKENNKLDTQLKQFQMKQQEFENQKKMFTEECQRFIIDFQTFKQTNDILQQQNYQEQQTEFKQQFEQLKETLQIDQKFQLDNILIQFCQVCYDLKFYIQDNNLKNEILAQLNDELDDANIKLLEQDKHNKFLNEQLESKQSEIDSYQLNKLKQSQQLSGQKSKK